MSPTTWLSGDAVNVRATVDVFSPLIADAFFQIPVNLLTNQKGT
jgi:hypothetical protein